ncbi:MAG: tRNA (N6-isopentenyl adenosine(37)-C2)-methylthiotransferase MiaB [Fimbriimonas sp.]
MTPIILQRTPPQKSKRGTYFVQTWGCQMNVEDSEQLELHLQQMGFEAATSILEAEVILLNTCSVRRKPEDKAFSMLGELLPIKEARPNTVIGVCGCMAQLRAEEIHRRAPHVDFVIGTGDLAAMPGLVEEAFQKRKFRSRLELPDRKGAVVDDVPQRAVGRTAKLKAFVPIQYGCDKFCTFCIVPTTRGRERSRSTADILEEITQLAAQGTKEVTLLGQTVNSYGKNLVDGKVPFSELLWRISEIPGIERIRYTSPYPRDFRSALIDTIRDCPKVMEHCHMPIQAGSDILLQRMKRLYSIASFREIVAELREKVPGISLTTDIIVGFPGETEEEFEATLAIVEEIQFDGAYMFAYSIRPGTPAATMEAQVPYAVKKARLNRLIEAQNRITCDINARLVGQEFEVLIEGPSPKNPSRLQGYTREFRMMNFEASPDRIGRLARVRATGSAQYGLSGELV